MLEEQRICSKCLNNDSYLNTLIASDPDSNQSCGYCDSTCLTMSMGTLADNCDWLIENYYSLAEYNQLTDEYDGDPLSDILGWEVSENQRIISDLEKVLSEKWFDCSSHEKLYGNEPHFTSAVTISGNLSHKWTSMEKKLRESNRFFNREALDTLQDVFEYIHKKHPSAFIDYPIENNRFYRARVFQSLSSLADALKRPEDNFGPPPSDLAPSGRMNARGISVFYGATSKDIAISEVRPPVGSYVVVAKFQLLRAIRLLDTTLLNSVIIKDRSRFDPEYLHEYERCNFIKGLSRQLVMPVVPELQERNYLLTQAIADYLSTSESFGLDGIMFPSAQTPTGNSKNQDRNVVLFHKSSSVQNAKKRTTEAQVRLYQSYEEGDYFEPEFATSENDFKTEFSVLTNIKSNSDVLALNLNEIEIHEVQGVEYKTNCTSVTHYEK